jgi:hypothetical protein
MARVSDVAVAGAGQDEPEQRELSLTGSLAVAVLAGAALAVTARVGATALLVAVAAIQALLGFAWIYGTRLPGRRGALVIAALAAAGSDVCVSVWPSSRLGTELIVFALAIPVIFVHQLMRGAARTRIVESLSSIAVLVLAVSALPALLQLRHEFGRDLGGQVVSGVVVVAAGAIAIGCLVDLIYAAPRFDPDVPRGLLAVAASAGLGGSLGYLMLQTDRLVELHGGRGAFLGAALGVLIGLFAVGIGFVEHSTPVPGSRFGQRMRPVLGALVPLAVLSPIAFLLCLAIRG